MRQDKDNLKVKLKLSIYRRKDISMVLKMMNVSKMNDEMISQVMNDEWIWDIMKLKIPESWIPERYQISFKKYENRLVFIFF